MKEEKLKQILRAFTALQVCVLLASCYHRPEAVSVASIAPSTEWRVEPNCGYEGCYPLVDFLVSKDLKVRVEPRNSKREGICTVAVTFITPESASYTFTPSDSILNFENGRSKTSHDFTCSYTIYSKDSFNSDNYLKKSINLKGYCHKGWRYDCFILYFDTMPPETEDSFSLDIRGLEKDGVAVVLPRVYFSKGMR